MYLPPPRCDLGFRDLGAEPFDARCERTLRSATVNSTSCTPVKACRSISRSISAFAAPPQWLRARKVYPIVILSPGA